MNSIIPRSPSICFAILRTLVVRGILRRGYARMLKHLPPYLWGGKDILVETRVGNLILPSFEPSASNLLFWGEIPGDKHETQIIFRLMKTFENPVIDIGAHLGYYTFLMNAFAKRPDPMVYSFEPDPKLFQYLSLNASQFSGIACYQEAVGSNNEIAKLWLGNSADLNSVVRPVGKQSILVKKTTLDAFIDREGIQYIDFVKVDTEGGELDVFLGARNLRTKSSPIWMVEISSRFITETGAKLGDMIDELNWGIDPLRAFDIDELGELKECSDLAQCRNKNVFLVPVSKIPMIQKLSS